MAETTLQHAFFYNSENGDRVYDADSFSEWLRKFFTTGVFAGELQVLAGEGMQVSVQPGYCNINGKVKNWPQATLLDVTTANATYDRIDTVVVERNDSDRDFTVKVIKGSATDTPTPKVPVREDAVYQLVLAQIYVKAGVTEVTQADITDTRTDTDLCGMVAGTVKEMNFNQFQSQFDSYFENYKKAIFEQYEAYLEEIKRLEDAGQLSYDNMVSALNSHENDYTLLFQTWFAQMKGQLSEDAAGNLQNEVDDISDGVASKTQTKTTVFNTDGSITETLEDGRKKTTVFEDDGSITETFMAAGGSVIWKNKTTFEADGSIKEEKVNG